MNWNKNHLVLFFMVIWLIFAIFFIYLIRECACECSDYWVYYYFFKVFSFDLIL